MRLYFSIEHENKYDFFKVLPCSPFMYILVFFSMAYEINQEQVLVAFSINTHTTNKSLGSKERDISHEN